MAGERGVVARILRWGHKALAVVQRGWKSPILKMPSTFIAQGLVAKIREAGFYLVVIYYFLFYVYD